MKRMLFNATYHEELRVATVEGQKLINFDIETISKTQRRSNIYKGVITRIEPSLEACFVDYGTDKQGFLPFKEIDSAYLPEGTRGRDFSKLTENMELIVQVEKDERGNKGAALTTHISLPGRYLVLMPSNSRSVGISRRIEGEERDELRSVLSLLEVPDGMSIIARTAAIGRAQEELQWDLNYLLQLWNAIKSAAASHNGSFLIYQESSLVIRSIRDHFSPDIQEILIDMEDIYQQAHQFMSHVMPNFVDRVKFYRDDIPLFSRFQIEHQIESAYSRTVHLPSGGAIVIDHTEALTAIDVNSAKSNKGSDIEATAFTTNLEAAEEISRQMRLRDLGGLVVVDFIDMENIRNQREVENFFKSQIGLDRARIQMGKLSKFGLLELSRQRLQSSLEESTTIQCPRCAGVGSIRGTESIAVHILRIVEEDVVKNVNNLSALHVQLPVDVATYLLNEKRDDVAKIENRMGVRIVLVPNLHLSSPNYKIRKVTNEGFDTTSNKVSYNLVETPEEPVEYPNNDKKLEAKNVNKAMVKNITPAKPAPIISNSPLSQVINKFLKLFKNKFVVEEPVKKLPKSGPVRTNSGTSRTHNTNNSRTQNRNKPTNARGPKPTTQAKTVNPNNVNNPRPNSNNPRPRNFNAQNKFEAKGTPTTNSTPANITPQVKSPNLNNTKPSVELPLEINVSTVENVKPKPTQNHKTEFFTPSETLNSNLNSTLDIEKKPDAVEPPPVIRVNTITEQVDLGSLQMVATDNSLKLTSEPETYVEDNLKRYKDVITTSSKPATQVEYELVETTNSNNSQSIAPNTQQ